MTIRKRVLYSGTVQGVGFRYSTRDLAQRYPVAGYVRNLPDGRVELVAEGAAEEVDAFLADVQRRMAGCIQNQAVHDESPEGLEDFVIRH